MKRAWTPNKGTHVGKAVNISLVEAYKLETSSMWPFFERTCTDGNCVYRNATWRFPIIAGFAFPISPADSASVWTWLEEISRDLPDLADTIFKPVPFFELNERMENGVRIWNGIYIENSESSVDEGGIVRVVNTETLSGVVRLSKNGITRRITVKHEFVHSLGFGHVRPSSWWPSIVSTFRNWSVDLDKQSVLSPEDVAYILAYYKTLWLAKEVGDQNVLAESHRGELWRTPPQ